MNPTLKAIFFSGKSYEERTFGELTVERFNVASKLMTDQATYEDTQTLHRCDYYLKRINTARSEL
jgi:hypothetical protein